ncbi:MAG: ABC transporter ATP-binding protein [Kiloniellales bacterium]
MAEGDAVRTAQLELREISKAFPGCLANDRVGLSVAPGEIHALLGENGAGKSTLVKIIYGVLRADSGQMLWQGAPVEIHSPNQARRLGIGMVFQHFSLFEAMTVTENIALGIGGDFNLGRLAAKVREVSEAYGLPLDPRRYVHSLSVGERQRIEVVRCLLQNPRLLIMDEPTSVLTPQEVERLFETLRRLSGEGVAILYISHKLEEIRALCHRATVLRGGRVVGECDPRTTSTQAMAQMMIGGDIKAPDYTHGRRAGEQRLKLQGLSLAADDQFGTDLQEIGFEVRGGEIVGIAGVAGNGQGELMAALTGERLSDSAEAIAILGRPVGRRGPRARRALGAAFVPEGRLGHGAVPEMNLSDNAYLSGYERLGLTRGGLIDGAGRDAYAKRIVADFDVRTHGIEADANSLSGGNLQKFIVGREILQEPRLIVVAQPTWGVDAGATAAIHRALIRLADAGAAILVISQDLDELLSLCDGFHVINEGRLSRSLDPTTASREEIGLLMGGVHGERSRGEASHAA